LSTQKTIISIFISITISVSILLLFVNYYDQTIISVEKNSILNQNGTNFYSKLSNSNNEKIFLIGSSQIGRFNETNIQYLLYENDQNYEVYNLAISGDTPNKRLNTIDLVLKYQPSLIVYGIGYRDFADVQILSEIDKPDSILPDPENISTLIITSFENYLEFDLELIKSPKTITIKLIKQILGQKDPPKNLHDRPNSPFYHTSDSNSIILNNFELKRSMAAFPYKLDSINPLNENKDVDALKEIINKIQAQKINLIIITIPYSQYYLETVTQHNENEFDLIIDYLSDELDIEIYKFHKNFTNKNIWNSNDHIAVGNSSITPNVELTKIISNFIGE
jgi:hypothetical protein